MRLFEFEAKKIFQKYGIPIPVGRVVGGFEEAGRAFTVLKPAVLKSQILVGGRGKAGGIKFPEDEHKARTLAAELLDQVIKGLPVKKLLVEEKLDIERELYLAVTVDRGRGLPVLLGSARGGMEVEAIARDFPEEMIRLPLDIRRGLPGYRALDLARRLDLRGALLKKGAAVISALYRIFRELDAEIVEINPLVVTTKGELVAADAKLNIDDNALYRQTELNREDEFLSGLEKRARQMDLGYVEMDGNIGVIGNGAGLNMTTLDILRFFGGEPSNFLEVSGRTYMLAEQALELVLSRPEVKVVFGNFFGSISRCDVIAQGLAKYIQSGKLDRPMVVSMRGNGAAEGKKILEDLGIPVFEDDRLAGEKAAQLAQEN